MKFAVGRLLGDTFGGKMLKIQKLGKNFGTRIAVDNLTLNINGERSLAYWGLMVQVKQHW